MVINTNSVSINLYNNLKIINHNKSNCIERISSGLKINKAADNASGLSISEKMKSQIRGLEQASRNVQDGISLIQVADGGLNEITNQLQKMRELSIQGLNGTLTTDDKKLIQNEIEQIGSGINDIANNTEFNGIKLLDGSLSKSSVTTTTTTTTTTSVTLSAKQMLIYTFDDNPTSSNTLSCANISNSTIAYFNFLNGTDTPGHVNVGIKDTLFNTLNNFIDIFNNIKNDPGNINYNNLQGLNAQISNDRIVILSNDTIGGSIGGAASHISKQTGNPVELVLNTIITTSTSQSELVDTPLSLQIGSNSNDKMNIYIKDVSLKSLGLDNINILNQSDDIISNIDNAISKVSSERSNCGAYNNALEHIYNNLLNTDENLTNANSKITDADLAKEMIELCKNDILEKVTTSLLAQSNQNPYQILNLLK